MKSALWASSSAFSPRTFFISGFDACRATRIPDLTARASTTTSPRPQRPRSSRIDPPPSWTVRFTAPPTSRRALSICSGFALTCAATFSPPRSVICPTSAAGRETPGSGALSSPARPSPVLSTLAGATVTGPRPLSALPAGNRTTLSAPKDCRRSSRSSPSHWPVCTDSGAMCTRIPFSVGTTSTCTRPSEPGFRETCSLPPPTLIRPSAVPAIRCSTVARRLSVRIAGCRADAPPARIVSARSPPEIRSVPDTTLSSNDWESKFQIGSASTGTGPVGGGRVRTTPSDPPWIGIARSGEAEECGLGVSCFSESRGARFPPRPFGPAVVAAGTPLGRPMILASMAEAGTLTDPDLIPAAFCGDPKPRGVEVEGDDLEDPPLSAAMAACRANPGVPRAWGETRPAPEMRFSYIGRNDPGCPRVPGIPG